MAEKLKFPARNYTPEYWDGHHRNDDCPVGVPFEDLLRGYPEAFRDQILMKDRLADQLERYRFLEGGVHVAMAEFDKGTTFVPDAYPHGTLVRVVTESLSFNYLEQGYEGFGTSEKFGFVVDTTGITERGRNGILYVHQNIIFGDPTEEIRVGEVYHRKRSVAEDLVNDLSRVAKVEVVSIGSGSRKRSRFAGVGAALGRLLPGLSPQPSPQPAG